jgi:hypothetical protein
MSEEDDVREYKEVEAVVEGFIRKAEAGHGTMCVDGLDPWFNIQPLAVRIDTGDWLFPNRALPVLSPYLKNRLKTALHDEMMRRLTKRFATNMGK